MIDNGMNVTGTQLWQMSATELARAIASGQASSREVIDAHLERIGGINADINAVTVIMAERAIEAANAADRALASRASVGPFHGVPFTIKANIDLLGAPTSVGLKAIPGDRPTLDAPVVERLKGAGGIPIGHTNLSTLTVRWHCESELWGATVNPWDRTRTPGASSGGEAAAIATGMSPMGLGNDGLGSLRWPANCCGVSTLKPTFGRIPNATTVEPAGEPIGIQLTAVQGPMARRVADLRAALEVVAGPTWRDPWAMPVSLRGPGVPAPIRVAVVIDPAGQTASRHVREGLERAATTLQAAGYKVDQIEPPSVHAAAGTLLSMLNTPETRAMWRSVSSLLPVATQRFLDQFFEAAGDSDPVTVMRSFVTRRAIAAEWGQFQQEHPLILAPVFTEVPFVIGTDLDDGAVLRTIDGMRMTMAVNALGLPAVVVPVGVSEGLPQSVQVIGPPYREDLCLDAAQVLEDALGIITPIDPR